MKILQVNTFDIGGGAEKVAFNLHKAYQSRNHSSVLVVGWKRSINNDVIEIPDTYTVPIPGLISFRNNLREWNRGFPGLWRLSEIVDWLARPGRGWNEYWGVENFHFPASKQLLRVLEDEPDIIHFHNLHGGYFDVRYLVELCKQYPVVITLHDEWLLTGHCAYTMDCDRWRKGCGSCPRLSIYPAIRRDATAYNWVRKKNIYRKSNLYVISPSQWLMERVHNSILQPAESRIIPNGIDLEIYFPGQRLYARNTLGFPAESIIILYAATRSVFKDNATILKAISEIDENIKSVDRKIIFVVLGGHNVSLPVLERIEIQNLGFISDPVLVAQYFQAADVFLHAAHAENFPNTILEAFACGTTVVATDVGGIKEQVEHGETGFLVPKGNSHSMAEFTIQLIKNDHLRNEMGFVAAETVKKTYSLEHQVDEYLSCYEGIIKNNVRSKVS